MKTILRFLTAYAAVLILHLASGNIAAESLWTSPQTPTLALSGDIHSDTNGRGFVIAADTGGHFAVTESAVVGIDTVQHQLVSSNGAWLSLRGVNTQVEVRKSFGSGLLPVDACLDLLPGADGQFGNLHCSNGHLRRMDGLAVTAVYSVPDGYRLRDLWSESRMLLERELDQALFVGSLQENPPAIVPMGSLGITSAGVVARLSVGRTIGGGLVVYQSGTGYRIVENTSISGSIAAAGELLPLQQCVSGSMVANRLIAVEVVTGELQLRTYDRYAATLLRQDPLEAGDRLVCTRSSPQGSFAAPHILRPQADGDQIFRANLSGLILVYTAVDPVRGAGQLLSVGQSIFVRYADGSVFRLEAPGAAAQTALFAPPVPRPIEAGTLAFDPLREYALTAEAGIAQVQITAREPDDGQVISTTNVSLGVDLYESAYASVARLLRDPSWPAQTQLVGVFRKRRGLVPPATVYYSIQGMQSATPLLDQQGAQVDLNNVVLSGAQVYGLQFTSNPPMLLRFGSGGSFQGQTQAPGTQLVGQADGSVLTVRPDVSGIVVSRVVSDALIWERPFATGCRVLDFGAFPLLSCEQVLPTLSTLRRLDAQTGNDIWQRLVTPLDLQLTFQARIAWPQDGELRVLSWGTRAGSRAVCVARLNPTTGALLNVSNTLFLNGTSFQTLGMHGFPFTHRWIHLSLPDGPRRQRIAIRVDSNGSISANLLGQSLGSEQVYFSESNDRIATNEGPRWYLSGSTQGYPATSAQAFPQTQLTQPLTLSHIVQGFPGREDRAGVLVSIVNPNPHDTLAARLHLSQLDCPQINRQSATIDINVPANSARQISCTAYFNADVPLETTAYLRQPLNGVLIRDFMQLPISIGTLGRDGFEGEDEQ